MKLEVKQSVTNDETIVTLYITVKDLVSGGGVTKSTIFSKDNFKYMSEDYKMSYIKYNISKLRIDIIEQMTRILYDGADVETVYNLLSS